MSALTMNDNVHLYDVNIGEFNYNQVITPNPLVINQTTLSFLELKDIHQEILNHIPNANIIDEICDATYLRQKAIASLKDDVDAIIVIGSKRSSNTLKLYELSLELHPSKKVIFVENIGDLKGFSLDFSHVALASGTSTPYQTVMEIKEYLERA